jgi:hypothetical protein
MQLMYRRLCSLCHRACFHHHTDWPIWTIFVSETKTGVEALDKLFERNYRYSAISVYTAPVFPASVARISIEPVI